MMFWFRLPSLFDSLCAALESVAGVASRPTRSVKPRRRARKDAESDGRWKGAQCEA